MNVANNLRMQNLSFTYIIFLFPSAIIVGISFPSGDNRPNVVSIGDNRQVYRFHRAMIPDCRFHQALTATYIILTFTLARPIQSRQQEDSIPSRKGSAAGFYENPYLLRDSQLPLSQGELLLVRNWDWGYDDYYFSYFSCLIDCAIRAE